MVPPCASCGVPAWRSGRCWLPRAVRHDVACRHGGWPCAPAPCRAIRRQRGGARPADHRLERLRPFPPQLGSRRDGPARRAGRLHYGRLSDSGAGAAHRSGRPVAGRGTAGTSSCARRAAAGPPRARPVGGRVVVSARGPRAPCLRRGQGGGGLVGPLRPAASMRPGRRGSSTGSCGHTTRGSITIALVSAAARWMSRAGTAGSACAITPFPIRRCWKPRHAWWAASAAGEWGPIDRNWRAILTDVDHADHILTESEFVKSTFVHQGWKPTGSM